MRTPCLNCKKRYLGCHDVCPKYQKSRQEIDKGRRNRRKENLYVGYYLDSVERMKRR